MGHLFEHIRDVASYSHVVHCLVGRASELLRIRHRFFKRSHSTINISQELSDLSFVNSSNSV